MSECWCCLVLLLCTLWELCALFHLYTTFYRSKKKKKKVNALFHLPILANHFLCTKSPMHLFYAIHVSPIKEHFFATLVYFSLVGFAMQLKNTKSTFIDDPICIYNSCQSDNN